MKFSNLRLPFKDFESYFSEEDLQSQVVIVSFFGQMSADGTVPPIFTELIKNEKLGEDICDNSTANGDICSVEMRYVADDKILYLNLVGPYHEQNFTKHLNEIREEFKTKGFLKCWNKFKSNFGKMLLFLFSISHIVIFYSPTPNLNLSHVQFLKVLSYVRPRYQTSVTNLLGKSSPITDDWIYHGRLCTPRLLFLFTNCPEDIMLENDEEKLRRVKKLEHALEDQIYFTLRKSRMVKNICNRAFFSIAPNDEFVFIQHYKVFQLDTDHLVDSIIKKLETFDMSNCGLYSVPEVAPRVSHEEPWHYYKATDLGYTPLVPGSIYPDMVDPNLMDPNIHITEPEFDDACSDSSRSDLGFEFSPAKLALKEHTFKSFLMKHVHKAHNEGFFDNMGKYTNMKPFFEVPTLETWFVAAHIILDGLDEMLKENQNDRSSCVLERLLGTELQFSLARCIKVMPLSLAVYQEGLPPHYNKALHEKQIKRAVSILVHHARGPEQQMYIGKLKDECDKIWKAGRQTCETLSLLKNSCTKPIHLTTNSGKSNYNMDVEHWNGIQYISSCNCGVTQTTRVDPFTLRDANFVFYQKVGDECGCSLLDCITFPTFQPSTHDYKAADVKNYEYLAQDGSHQTPQEVPNIYHDMPNTRSTQTLSIMNIGKLWTAEEATALTNATPLSHLSDQQNHLVLNYFSNHQHDKHLVRQVSTTEYLPGMLHVESPLGLLPEFPSWSLVCRGPSSLYSHNLGLHDQPGFLAGSNYLLPWDVTLGWDYPLIIIGNNVFTEKDYISPIAPDLIKRTHSVNNYISKSNNSCKKLHRCPKADSATVKIFIGVEYECVRGHRFMSSAPGKVLKASGNGIVKENAGKITKGNMPLYIPCPCGKVLAQLMRIHVVTPKAPVHVTIDPKVRPAPNPCPVFVTANQQPIPLSQSAYWVLRLPFIYATERNCYTPPPHLKKLKYGELLGPMYGISQIE